jgi:hypothetical protein
MMNGMEEKAKAVYDSEVNERLRCPGGKHASSSHLPEGNIGGYRWASSMAVVTSWFKDEGEDLGMADEKLVVATIG